MSRKKVLFLTEASYLNTGYATYGKNLLDYLYSLDRYDIAEFSIYGREDDERRKQIKWKNYPNIPDLKNKDQVSKYNESPINQFGAWRFERVCLGFKPDIVLSIRDFWMDSFIYESPFRRIFKWAWMPTVDASPQNPEWVHVFSNVDYVLTYSDWAAKILKEQTGNQINYIGTASPCANESFVPMNKEETRKEFGLDPEANIIGTVMRNQKRKLFPVLFGAFSRYLQDSGSKNTFLYCHTSYPDNGWGLAELLHEHGISSRVLFSYMCSNCGAFEVSKFNDSIKCCPNCSTFNSKPCSVNNGPDDKLMAKIYNLFDLYVQCANSEGFGLPQIEAAACGIPIATVDYSAMADVVDKLAEYKIPVSSFYKEIETGCDRACPSESYLSSIFHDYFNTRTNTKSIREQKSQKTRQKYDKYYSIEKMCEPWIRAIDLADKANWDMAPIIKNEDPIEIPKNIPNSTFIDLCCKRYLLDQKRLNSYEIRSMRNDLNLGIKKGNIPFSKVDALNYFVSKATISNLWEKARVGIIKFEEESWLNQTEKI